MKCVKCNREKLSLKEVTFKRNGMVPGTQRPRYDAICGDCTRKTPIDETSK